MGGISLGAEQDIGVSRQTVRRLLLSVGLLALPSVVEARPGARALEIFDDNLLRGGRYQPGELLVRKAPGARVSSLARALASAGCRIERQFGQRPLFRARCEAAELRPVIAALSRRPELAAVEAAWYDELEAVPNDLVELQWYHQNLGQTIDGQVGISGADLGSVDAWDVTAGTRSRIVAILDVGLYAQHLDLAPNIWLNTDEVCGNGLDDDNNGYVDDCRGRDVGEDDNDPSPLTMPEMRSDGSDCLRWHATFIAGLAGATGNNGGIAGTAWQVSLMNVKRHIDSTCRSTTARTVEAVYYALDNGAEALGMSFSSSSYSAEFEDALQAAASQGVISVMSAGNGGSNDDGDTRYPMNYNVARKVVVATTDNRDALDPASNYGATTVTMGAPGTFVVTTAIDDPQAYGAGTGTSMSVGFVLGLVPLLKTAYPQLTAAQLYDAIVQGGTSLPSLSCAANNRCVSSGRRLDAFGSLTYASNLYPPNLSLVGVQAVERTGNGNGTYNPGEVGELRFTAANAGPGPAYATTATLRVVSGAPEVSVGVGQTTLGPITSGSSVNASNQNAPSFVVANGCARDFTASFELVFADKFGHQVTQNATAEIRCVGFQPPPPPPDAGVINDSGSGPVDLGFLDLSFPGEDASATADSGVEVDVGTSPPVDAGPIDLGFIPAPGGGEVEEESPSSDGCRCASGAPASPWSGLLGLALLLVGPRCGRRSTIRRT